MNETDFARLVFLAIQQGFLRENPKARWNKEEEKEAARWIVQHLVGKVLK